MFEKRTKLGTKPSTYSPQLTKDIRGPFSPALRKFANLNGPMKSMKTGGMVKQTRPHMLHKGEMVIPATVVKHITKIIKK